MSMLPSFAEVGHQLRFCPDSPSTAPRGVAAKIARRLGHRIISTIDREIEERADDY